MQSFFSKKNFSRLPRQPLFRILNPAVHENVKNCANLFVMIVQNIFQLFLTFAKKSAFLANVVSIIFAIEMRLQRKCKINQYYCNAIIETITIKKSIFAKRMIGKSCLLRHIT